MTLTLNDMDTDTFSVPLEPAQINLVYLDSDGTNQGIIFEFSSRHLQENLPLTIQANTCEFSSDGSVLIGVETAECGWLEFNATLSDSERIVLLTYFLNLFTLEQRLILN